MEPSGESGTGATWKGDEMSEEYTVGDMVETAVFVGTKRIPMGRGMVVAVHRGRSTC